MNSHLKQGAVLSLLLVLLSGCTGPDPILPTTVYEYDLEAAVEMVDEAEWLCTWLQAQDSIPQDTVQALIARLNAVGLETEGINIVMTALADGADWEDETLDGWYLEYIFTQWARGGPWSFTCYNGQFNIEANLLLSEDFTLAAYNAP